MLLIDIRLNKCVVILFWKVVKRLEFVPDYYINQEMCNKPVDNYAHALEFAPNCHKTQETCS